MNNITQELVYAPLGGVGEIGMNLSLYGFGPEAKKHWIAVDCGVSFAGPDLPGIDLVMPDISYLIEERKNLLGLIITHGHEDHIGAIADLWPKLKCPLYATPFTAQLLEVRRLSEPGAPKIPIIIVPPRGRIELGPFHIEMINVAHSIPESQALCIRTPLGTVIHTGDWKIDPTPIVGEPTDVERLKQIGNEGVLAIVCDSTNAVRDGVSPSENDVAKELTKVIAEAKGRVAVTTFASNVSRIKSVAEAAKANDRQVVIVGRAMERVLGVAREMGMLDGIPPFVSMDQYGYLPREKVVCVLTGSQGEPRAALARIAHDEHPEIAFTTGDTVVFSSRTIPGNEKAVGDIINNLVRQGLTIITDRDRLVHVSGHPRRGELEMMYQWVRPAIAIPVHGEAIHLSEHAKLAKRMGVKEVLLTSNGEVMRLAPGRPDVVDEIIFGRWFKDGSLLISEAEKVVPERRKLSFAGVVSLAVALDDKGQLVSDIEIDFSGLPEKDAFDKPMLDIIGDAILTTLDTLPKARKRDLEAVRESLTRAVRSAVNHAWGKKPICHCLVLSV